MIKKIGSSAFVQGLLGYLVYLYGMLAIRTTRWTIEGWPEEMERKKESFLMLFWHGRFFTGGIIFTVKKPKMKCYVLSSLHRDGRILASLMERVNAAPIDGSARRGGVGAGLAIRRALKEESIITITPDSRRPGFRMSRGSVVIARDSGCPIVPMAFSSNRAKRLKTWDRCLLPLPFGKGIVLVGEPVYIPAEADEKSIEEWRKIIENKLNELTVEADRRTGFPVDAELMKKDA